PLRFSPHPPLARLRRRRAVRPVPRQGGRSMGQRTRRVSQSLPHRRPDDPAASPCVPDPEEGSATCGDVKRALVRIPKGTVRGRVYPRWHRMRLQDPALRIPDIDHWARTANIGTGGGYDIPLSIEAHAINPPLRSPVILAELMQDSVAAQRAIRLNVVG